MRLVALLGLVGIWHAASLLHGSVFVTASFTAGAVALAVWAFAVLHEE